MFYVYGYLRKKDLTPYYIGKGLGKRAYSSEHSIKIPDDKRRIIMLETGLSELGAFALERRYIRWYGRKDLGTGILQNKTDGGEGTCGVKCSQETKDKISKANKGVSRNKGRLGRRTPQTIESNLKRSQTMRGRLAHNKGKSNPKVSAALKGKPPWNKGLTGRQVAWNKGVRLKPFLSSPA